MVFTLIKRASIILTVAALAACSTTTTAPDGAQTSGQLPPVVDVSDDAVLPPAKVQPKQVSTAADAPQVVINLLGKAKQQYEDGENANAMATVERAIRIAPRYAPSYYQLAVLKFEGFAYQRAKVLADKAISLGASDQILSLAKDLIKQSNQLISQGY